MRVFRKRRSALGLAFLAILWAELGWTQSKDPDVNGDGVVNILDISLLSGCIRKDLSVTPQCRCADTNGDSIVDFADMRFVASAYGRSGFPLDPTACSVSANTPPSADAGPDQTVLVLDTVTLDGSGSTDAEGDPLTFSWTLTVVPPTSAATLSDPGAVKPTFFVDVRGTYVAELIVNDGTDDSAPDTVTITTRNSAPVADAGPDQTALVTETVILDASGSSDVDGDALSFSWSFDSVPAGSAAFLSDPSAVNPSFVVDRPGTYVVDLVVSDGAVDSAPDRVVVTTENAVPVADAGADQTALVREIVTLDGSGSSDVDGDLLTFSWSLTSVPLGSAASLDDPTSPRPSLEVDEPGTYVAQLIVNDGSADSFPDTVNVTTENSAPVADAGLDQSVLVGDTVRLDGTGSLDVDHDPLTFDWALTTRPAGSGAFLDDPKAQMPAFTVDLRGTYVVQVVVHDGTVGSTPDTVVITTGNSPPVADAGPDQTVIVNDTVSLDGSASFDADLDPLTFDWSFLSIPPGSAATLSNGTAVDPSFTADLRGTYVVQLIVNDGTLDSAPDTVVITAGNSPPVADAGPDQTAATGATVQLDGRGSSDPDGTPLASFSWSLVSRPAGSAAALFDPAAVAPTFVADRVGAYVAELIVSDGAVDSAPDTVVVTVLDAADLRIAFVNPPTTPAVDVAGVGILTAAAVAAGETMSCALLAEGTVKCWGFNDAGELGTGNQVSSTTPVFVSGITTATAVAAGNRHACALLSDATVKCWGGNNDGQLGNGIVQRFSFTPVLVSGITTATAIAAGTAHSCAVLSDGTVRCWGRNSEGQLGDGTTGGSTTPVLVSGITTATAVAAGGFHTCALLSDGAVRCWGLNGTGNLGNGTSTGPETCSGGIGGPLTPCSTTPVGVTGISTATAIGAGVNHSCALLSDATSGTTVQCWGGNSVGQLGTGSATGPETCSGSSCSTTPVGVIGINTATALGAGHAHTCATLVNGTVRCWGQNNVGQLGNGTTGALAATPVEVLRIDTATAVAGGSLHTCARLSNGMARCWGRNDVGQLGDGTIGDSTTPVGSGVNLRVQVSNDGPSGATSVTARFQVPAGYTLVSGGGPSQGSYDPATGDWTVGSLDLTARAELSLFAMVHATGPHDLLATITGSSQPDPNLANNTATATVTLPVADLGIEFYLPSTTTTPPVGSVAQFFVIVRNLGPASTTSVTARVPLPGYTFVNVGGSGTYDAATGNWTIGSLLPNQGANLILSATVNPTGPYDLTVAITESAQPDPNPANNTATMIVTPNPNADLGVVFLNAPSGTFPYGAEVGLFVEVTNAGPAATAGVVFRFQAPPAGFTVTAGGTNEGTYDHATGTWAIGSMVLNGRAHLNLRLSVNATGPVGLIATVTGSQPDPNLANNTAAPAPLNRPPAANAGPDQAVSTNATVALDGTGSGDPDGDPVIIQWRLIARAGRSTATLSNPNTLAPSFIPDQGGRYVAQLTLTDSHGVASAPDSATIMAEVLNHLPVIWSAAVTAGAVGQAYRYDVEATDSDVGDSLTFSLVTAPAGMTVDPATGLIQWTPGGAQGGPQNVAVRVQDAGGFFATQAFTVQVSSPTNQAPVAVDDAYEVRTIESLGVGTPGVLSNDSDADGTPLVATLLTPTANGTVSLNPDGSFTYTPHALGEGDLVFAANVNLATRVPGATVAAGLTFGGGLAAFAADDDIGTSWRASGFETSPSVEVSFPQAVTVTELQVFGHRDPFLAAGGIRNTAGFFQLFAADGTELHNSGSMLLPAPNGDALDIAGSISGVRRARFTVTAFIGEAGLAEFKVIGSALVRRERFVPGNLTQLLPTVASASSVFAFWAPELAIDDSLANWYAASAAAGVFLELAFPVDVTVTELQTANPSLPPDLFSTFNLITCSGNFALIDVNGAVLFDSGVVNEPSGRISASDTFTLPVPSVGGVRRVRWTSAGCGQAYPPGFSEFRVIGSAPLTTPAFSLAKKFQALVGREVHSTPIVANLTDDNGDGRIDTRDIPDIVVPVESVSDQLKGEIKVVSGDDGRELFTLGNTKLVSPWSEVAVGNLDGDSVPEIVAVHSDGNHLIAFDLEGGAVQGNLTQLLTPLAMNVSSRDPGRPEENAVDGDLSTSWFNLAPDTANLGASPFLEVAFPQEVTATELQMFGQRGFTNSSFLAGIFRLFAADGTVLFDSGVVNLPAPNRDINVAIPSIAGVRRVRFTGTADQSSGCCGNSSGIAELRVIGSAVVPKGVPKIKWISDPNPMPRFIAGNAVFIDGAVSIANLDGEGSPEIVVGASVFDSQGRLLGDGRTLGGTTSNIGRRSAVPAVADLDLDGVPEVVAGPTAYLLVSGQLTKVWQRTDRPDGYVGIANFDDDPFPEIVIVGCPPDDRGACNGPGQLYMLNHDGSDAEVWNPPTHAPIPLPGGGDGGAPTIADLDGDGIPEIGVAAMHNYSVFNRDGTVRWQTVIRDYSSHSTGSTVFDFDGDGSVELVYRDEQFLRIYRGEDGVVLARIPIGSSTWTEEPVVADVDNDGHADIVVSSDRHLDASVGSTGVFVVQDVANKWARTRRIWNQHSYHVTNVNEDGSIPLVETPHWLAPGLNNFRLNTLLPGEGADQADRFTYRASDGTLLSNIATVRITLRARNSPPVITSSPVTTAATFVLYTYVAQADDPDPSDILTFSLPTAPAGMTVDPVTGVIHWTPTVAQLGAHEVVVKVQDVGGLFGLQGFEVEVGSPVTVPDVVGQTEATAQATIVAATLTVGAIGTRNSPTAPTGSALSQSPAAGALVAPGSPVGFVVSLGPAPLGTVPDVVGQTQGSAEADIIAAGFVVGAITGQHHATVPLGVVLGQDPAGGTQGTQGSAVNLLVSLGPPPGDVDLDGDGFTPDEGDCDDDNAAIRPGAADVPGDGIDQDCNGRDAIEGDQTAPTASISSPADGAVVTMPTDIVGSATDDHFLSYRLEFASVDAFAATVIGASAAPVVNGLLGRIDPTQLENGLYRVRLIVEDVNGALGVDERVYRVSGEAKVGLMTLSFIDLRVPVSGIPITVVRSYDSRVKTSRDFGVGWNLDIKTGTYQNNRRPGDGWVVATGGGPFGLPCTLITETRTHFTELRLSDREFYLFRPKLTNLAALVGGCVGEVAFEFVDGSLPAATLKVLGNADILYTSGDAVTEFDGSTETGLVFDPRRVRLQTIDGRVIDFDRASGIVRIQDSNANSLSITPGGIAHSTGSSIAFARDAQGRITRITDPKGNQMTYAYDARGDLVEFVDQAGNKTAFAYDPRHNLVEIRDPLGDRALRSEYDAEGRLVAMVDANGRRTEFSHDVAGREEIVTDALGRAAHMRYDEQGNILLREEQVTIDGASVTARQRFAYDARNNVTLLVDADDLRQEFTYDASGNQLTATVDPTGLGIVRRTTYTPTGDVLIDIDPNAERTTFAYDGSGNPTEWTDVDGRSSLVAYDRAGQVTRVVDPDGRANHVAYDAFGRVRARTDALGNVRSYTHDANGNGVSEIVTRTVGGIQRQLETRFEHDALNRLTRVIDPLGQETRSEYDALGRLARRILPLGRVTSFGYDQTGSLVRTTYPDGTTEGRVYDAVGNLIETSDRAGLVTRFEYDELRRQTAVLLPGGRVIRTILTPAGRTAARIGPDGARTDHEYDSAKRPTVMREPSVVDGSSGGEVRPEWRFEYDAGGRTTAVVDPNGDRTERLYDAAAKTVTIRLPDGTEVSEGRDQWGRILTKTDQEGQSVSFDYFANTGLLASVALPPPSAAEPGPTWQFSYDEVGNRLSQTDPLGRTTSFTHDEVNRLAVVRLPGGRSRSFGYDAAGRLIRLTDFDGTTSGFEYDAADRLVRRTLSDGRVTAFTYTPAGQRASVTDERGSTTYDYDELGRLARVTQPDVGEIAYGYDLLDRVSHITTRAGATGYAYDALDRLVQVTSALGHTTYDYDAAGNLTRLNLANGTSGLFAYDQRRQLTSLDYRRGGDPLASFAYAYTPAGGRSSVTEANATTTFAYDGVGRLIEETRAGGSAFDRRYEYDGAGNRTRMVADGVETLNVFDVDDRLLSSGSTSFRYDDRGNLVERNQAGTVTAYSWTADNRLTSITANAGSVAYRYDSDGNRVEKRSSQGIVRYLVDALNPSGLPQVIEEQSDSGSLLKGYTYGRNLISGGASAAPQFYHPDGQANIRMLTDPSGQEIATYAYDAFGNLVEQSGQATNDYLYGGQQIDLDANLYYLRARYYDPTAGRFLGTDPRNGQPERPLSLHRYLYAGADPCNFADPTGEDFTLLGLSFAQVISGGARGIEINSRLQSICRLKGLAKVIDLVAGLRQAAASKSKLLDALANITNISVSGGLPYIGSGSPGASLSFATKHTLYEHPQAKRQPEPLGKNGDPKKLEAELAVKPGAPTGEVSLELALQLFGGKDGKVSGAWEIPGFKFKQFTAGVAAQTALFDVRVCGFVSVGTVFGYAEAALGVNGFNFSASGEVGIKMDVPFLPGLKFSVLSLPNDLF